MSEVPGDLKYSAEHEWVRGEASEGSEVTVGITAYAAEALGDVVYAELPAVGATVEAGVVCGELESTKAVSELFSPVGGTVTVVNDALTATPETINADPFGEAWLFKVKVSAAAELLDAEQYTALIS